MTTNILNTKIGEFENKIPDVRGLVKKTDYITKISDIGKKYFTTSNYNTFTSKIINEKIKQANLTTNIDFNTVSQRAIKNEEKIENLNIFDLSYFIGKNIFGDDGFQNMFIYQPRFINQYNKVKRTQLHQLYYWLEIKRDI